MTALLWLGTLAALAACAGPVCYGAIVGWRALDARQRRQQRPAAPAAPRRRRAHA